MSTTYQGRPCKRGHIGRRYICNGACVECVKQYSKARAYRVAGWHNGRQGGPNARLGRWTQEQFITAWDMRERGHRLAEIASVIGRSESAIMQKLGGRE